MMYYILYRDSSNASHVARPLGLILVRFGCICLLSGASGRRGPAPPMLAAENANKKKPKVQKDDCYSTGSVLAPRSDALCS